MIAVIADDLTGAAELGGLGLRYNLAVEIATEVDVYSKAELLVISADTRSISEKDAVAKIKKITRELLALEPALIYKKIDSVLRGHVVAELTAQMEAMQLSRSLVIPANPYLERIIKDEQYYFKGQLIHLSSFSHDPEFPILSSSVADMLRAKGGNVQVIQQDQSLPSTGIAVGEVEKDNDLKLWAEKIDKNTVLAGAAGFFAAVLDKMHVQGKGVDNQAANNVRLPMLFVCGTTFNRSRTLIREVKANGGPVSYMPETILTSPEVLEAPMNDWSDEVAELVSANGKAIIAIEESTVSAQANSNDLRQKTAYAVNRILQKTQIKELVVEGGSTAASIIRKQHFSRLFPVSELSPGVIRMRVEGEEELFFTIKPGSYNWSPQLWQF